MDTVVWQLLASVICPGESCGPHCLPRWDVGLTVILVTPSHNVMPLTNIAASHSWADMTLLSHACMRADSHYYLSIFIILITLALLFAMHRC